MSQDDDNQPRTPRVILSADRVFWTTDRPAGYSPALGVQMARAHCWAPYDSVASALRSLSVEGEILSSSGGEAARKTLRGLFQHPAPFGPKARFPQGRVFLSVDRGVFGQCVHRILTELVRAQAASGTYGPDQTQIFVRACEAFMEAVAAAAAALDRPEVRAAPVLYDRLRFEEAFGLTWKQEALLPPPST